MENTEILGLSVVILIGIVFTIGFKKRKEKKIADRAIDEIRRVLWEKEIEATDFRQMGIVEAFKHFGFRALPNAAYKDNYFVEVTTSSTAEKTHFVRIVLAFDKEILETEWK